MYILYRNSNDFLTIQREEDFLKKDGKIIKKGNYKDINAKMKNMGVDIGGLLGCQLFEPNGRQVYFKSPYKTFGAGWLSN